MNPIRLKSALIIAGTLLIGGIVGAFTTSAIMEDRVERIRTLRTTPGFADMMEKVIGIDESAQAEHVRPILEETSTNLRQKSEQCGSEMASMVNAMTVSLAPHLTDAQQENLERWLESKHRRGPPGRPHGRTNPDRTR